MSVARAWKVFRQIATRERRFVDTFLLRDGPLQNVGGVAANRLGLQVARTLGQRLAWHLRPQPPTAGLEQHLATLARDGILSLPDFFPPPVFHQIRAEYEQSRRPPLLEQYQQIYQGVNFVSEELMVSALPREFPAFKQHFEDNPLLRRLAAAVMRRQVDYPPQVSVLVRHKVDPALPHEDHNSAVLHSDRHYPTVKVFYYINDVSESNGPYTYALGSHKLTLARLRHQYEFSIRSARLRRGLPVPEHLVDRGLNVVSEESRARMKIVETPMVGRANTLIITDNIGFHRRGDFSDASPRVSVNMDFNYLESWGRFLFPLLRHL